MNLLDFIACFQSLQRKPLAILLALGMLLVSCGGGEGGDSTQQPSPPPSPTNIVQAKSCSQQDVQTAIILAKDGDTVQIPAGTCIWTFPDPGKPAPSVLLNGKAITLQGAGTDQTILVNGMPTSNYNDVLLRIDDLEGKPFRVTGMTFKYTGQGRSSGQLMAIYGTCKNWRLDHLQFEYLKGSVGRALLVNGYTTGVIDHCRFLNSGHIYVNGERGDAPWKRPLTLGTDQAVYIERCEFINDGFYGKDPQGAVDAMSGDRYVFRYNDVTNALCCAHGLQNTGMRGTFSYELYENTFTSGGKVDGNNYMTLTLRGGTGVVFNNQVTNVSGAPYVYFCLLRDYRSCEVMSTQWGPCLGDNPVDGNEPGQTGYPCLDQIGRSTDAGLNMYHPQALEPVYGWNNYMDGKEQILISEMCANSIAHVQEGRDFYSKTARPNYIPYVFPHPLTVQSEKGRLLNLRKRIESGRVILSWDAVSEATQYKITRDWKPLLAVASTTCSDAAPGKTYLVSAVNSAGTVVAMEGLKND